MYILVFKAEIIEVRLKWLSSVHFQWGRELLASCCQQCDCLRKDRKKWPNICVKGSIFSSV